MTDTRDYRSVSVEFPNNNQNSDPDSSALHLVADFHGCHFDLLNDKLFLLQLFEDAARLARAKIIHSYAHQFEPFGVTLVVVISTSHLSLHTWPEEGFCALDIYTCGGDTWPRKALNFITDVLKPTDTSVTEVSRGFVSEDQTERWTTHELAVLTQHYNSDRKTMLELLPSRSWEEIENKAKRLGLTIPRPIRI